MQFTEENRIIKPNHTKAQHQKTSEKFDKPIPKPKMPLEDSISKHKGLSRENYGVNVIL